MDATTPPPETFHPLKAAATLLGVPAAWLEREAGAGKVPHLKVGKRLLFNLPLAEKALLDRAAAECGAGVADAR